MTTEKRGLKSVKTMGGLGDLRRARSPAGALMELSVLANEKRRLQLELDRCQRRHNQIAERLAEITAKEARLYGFVKEPPPVAQVRPAADNGQRLRAKELCY